MSAATIVPEPSLFRWDNSDASENAQAPRQPQRRVDDEKEAALPTFLAAETVGPNRPPPRRRPPARSRGFHEATMDLYKIPVKPLEFIGKNGKGSGSLVKEGMARVLQDIVVNDNTDGSSSSSNKDVTVVFAIRVPGCGQCREHGVQLSELAERENIAVKGVIKEIGADDEALLEFYTEYFNFPLYTDESMNLYNIIGNEKLNMWTLFTKGRSMHQRVDAKGIRSAQKVKGEGLTQGGVLIFDKKGKLCFVYYETFGQELDMEAIHWAVDQAAQN